MEADEVEVFSNGRRGGGKRELDGVGVNRHGSPPVLEKVLLLRLVPYSVPFRSMQFRSVAFVAPDGMEWDGMVRLEWGNSR